MRIGDATVTLFIGRADSKGLSFRPGETLQAEVIDVLNEGNILLKIKAHTLKVRSEIPFNVGQLIKLKVIGIQADGDLKMRFVEYANPKIERIQTYLESLKAMLDAGLLNAKTTKFNQLMHKVLKIISGNPVMPDEIKTRFEEILLKALRAEGEYITERLLGLTNRITEDVSNGTAIEKIKALIKGIEELQGDTLKTALENTGLIFEARLKRIIQDNKREGLDILLDKDLKANLLRLSRDGILKTEVFSLIREIEAFQTFSKVTDSFYAFLPLIWKELRDADIMFKKRKDKGGSKEFFCRLNLDLKKQGRLNVTVTLHNKDFFVSFFVEDPGFHRVIEENKELLQGLFVNKGLNLKAINVVAYAKSSMPDITEGINIKA